jgi:hypothetical protein
MSRVWRYKCLQIWQQRMQKAMANDSYYLHKARETILQKQT